MQSIKLFGVPNLNNPFTVILRAQVLTNSLQSDHNPPNPSCMVIFLLELLNSQLAYRHARAVHRHKACPSNLCLDNSQGDNSELPWAAHCWSSTHCLSLFALLSLVTKVITFVNVHISFRAFVASVGLSP